MHGQGSAYGSNVENWKFYVIFQRQISFIVRVSPPKIENKNKFPHCQLFLGQKTLKQMEEGNNWR